MSIYIPCVGIKRYHSEHSVAPATGFVHFGLPNVPSSLSSCQQLKHMVRFCHNLLPQAGNIDTSLLALMYLKLGILHG